MTNIYKRKHYVLGAIIIYAFLLLVFALSTKKDTINEPCSWASLCVRFCCHDQENCNDTYIRQNFNVSLFMTEDDYEFSYDAEAYKILYGNPTCELHEVPKSVNWSLLMHGDVSSEQEYFDLDAYCFEPSDSVNDTAKVSWDLFVCNQHKTLGSIIFHILWIASVILLSAPVLIFAYFPELRTVHGKCVMLLTAAVLITFSGLLMVHSVHINQGLDEIGMLIIMFGLVLSFLWMTVLTFDVWWNFRDFQATSNDTRRFKWYCAYVLGFSSLVVLPIFVQLLIFHIKRRILKYIFAFFFLALIATGLIDICFILLTAYKIFRMSRALSASNTRFKYEKERFWTVLELYAVMTICWPLEIISWHTLHQTPALIVLDIILFFSALLISAILILQDKVKRLIFKRYDNLLTTTE